MPKCPTRKFKYDSKHEADTAIEKINRREMKIRPSNSYKCKCGYWHMTSKAQQMKPKYKRKGRYVDDNQY